MLMASFRRSRRSGLRLGILLAVLVFVVDIFRITSVDTGVKRSTPSTRNVRKEKIFIASIHWNNAAILRSHWNDALVEVVRYFGAENVYVTVLESGSWDDSKAVLRQLDAKLAELGVDRTVELDETTHKDEITQVPESSDKDGWIWTSRGKWELRRISYLSRLRNRVMRRLNALAEQQENPKLFDKVLWLNDVIFTVEDVLTLLDTRDGHYAAACALDFSRPPSYYDTFALRDASGAKPVMSTWPYFRSYRSRRALMSNLPVPVRSCWNGIVAFDAKPFYSKLPLQFRGIADSLARHHLEGSECCLIHADNPLSAEKGVWLNPMVRVGYNSHAYDVVGFRTIYWPTTVEKISGMWSNRWARLSSWPRKILEDAVTSRRLSSWKSENASGLGSHARPEPGTHCLINEMQVLVENGWAHV